MKQTEEEATHDYNLLEYFMKHREFLIKILIIVCAMLKFRDNDNGQKKM